MENIPNDIILQIGLRVNHYDLESFFSTSKSLNFSKSEVFWRLRCEYEFGYNPEKYLNSDFNGTYKYKLLKFLDITKAIESKNLEEFKFIKEAPKYNGFDFEALFENAIKNNDYDMVKLLIQDTRVDPNIHYRLLFSRRVPGGLCNKGTINANLFNEVLSSSHDGQQGYHPFRPSSFGFRFSTCDFRDDGEERYIQEDILNIFLKSSRFDPGLENNYILNRILNSIILEKYKYFDYKEYYSIIESLVQFDSVRKNITNDFISDISIRFKNNILYRNIIKILFSHSDENNIFYLYEDNSELLLNLNIIFDRTNDIKELYNIDLDVLFEKSIIFDAYNTFKYLLYETECNLENIMTIIYNNESNNVLEVLLAYPGFNRTEKDIIDYLDIEKGYNMFPILWNIPEYQTVFRNNKCKLFKKFKRSLKLFEILIEHTDLVIDDKETIKTIVFLSSKPEFFIPIIHRLDVDDKKICFFGDSERTIKLLLSKNMIDLKTLGNLVLVYSIKFFNVDLLKLFLEQDNLYIDENNIDDDIEFLNNGIMGKIFHGFGDSEEADNFKNMAKEYCDIFFGGIFKNYINTFSNALFKNFLCPGPHEVIKISQQLAILILNDSRFNLYDKLILECLPIFDNSFLKDVFNTFHVKRYIETEPKPFYKWLADYKIDRFKVLLNIKEVNPCACDNILLRTIVKKNNSVKIDLLMNEERVKNNVDVNKLIGLCCKRGHLESFNTLIKSTSDVQFKDLLLICIENDQTKMLINILDNFEIDISSYKEDLLEELELRGNNIIYDLIESY